MKTLVGLRAKIHTYLKDSSGEDKKSKKCAIKRKLKFEDFKNCLEAAQIENKINHSKKNNINEDILKKEQQEFIKNNKLILKTQRKFRSE